MGCKVENKLKNKDVKGGKGVGETETARSPETDDTR